MSEDKKTAAVKKAAAVKTVKVEALESLSGKYKLPWDLGQKFDCEEKQAAELVESGSAKYVK